MTTTYPLVQFVDSPDPAATVRFDFNTAGVWSDGETWPAHDGWTLGAPTLSGDPDGIGTEYGFRELSFNLLAKGTPSVVAELVSTLSRELRRQTNWLMFQFSELSAPVWFKTYRSAPSALDFEYVRGMEDTKANLWGVGVKLDADPFAYGEQVTLSTVTVNNNPAAGTNPCRYVLPDVVGDAPAPLRLALNPSNRGTVGGWRWLHHMHAGDTAVTPIVWQIGTSDGWTLGTDTAAATSSASYSGGSYRAVSFATNAGMTERIKGNAPSAVPPGRYKVLARIARSDTDSTFQVRFAQALFSAYLPGPAVDFDRDPSSAAGHATWLDLGEFTFPRGTTAPPEVTGAGQIPDVALQMSRTSGTGSANLDTILLLPIAVADTDTADTLITSIPVTAAADSAGVDIWDGDLEETWKATSGGDARPMAAPSRAGGFVAATPGTANVLTLLQLVNPDRVAAGVDNTDTIAATTDVTISYRPRWLHLAAS